jgi:DNA-directed RNA polymerase specialized sigma subunit
MNKYSVPIDNEEEVIKKYLPMIDTHILHTKIKYNKKFNIDYDDLFSTLQLALLKAVRSYEAGKGTTMKTWITNYFIGYTLNYIRDNKNWLSRTVQLSFIDPTNSRLKYTIEEVEREEREVEREEREEREERK